MDFLRAFASGQRDGFSPWTAPPVSPILGRTTTGSRHMTGTSVNNNPTRRTALATLAGASVATPHLWTRSASAAQQLVVRTPGGVFDDVKRETVYEPFRKATGVEIVP